MKSVAIFRHAATEGPGYLGDFLDQQAIPWQLIRIDAGELVPREIGNYCGLVFMGGPMSVNDDLPWIPPLLALIDYAIAHDIPVLGHCLGGQLMAKAMGGVVTRNPVKEIGWGQVTVSDNEQARAWFGETNSFEAFHWHGETFSLPQGATHLLSSEHCGNQGFSLGKHLALQCHVEMTAELIRSWCEVGADEVAANSNSPAVQPVPQILKQMEKKLPSLNAIGARLYQHWIAGLDRTALDRAGSERGELDRAS